MLASRVLIVVILCLFSHLAPAQVADPWKNWLSADSAHFRIHYRAEHRVQAERAARAAERAYPRITQLLKWEPRGRTEIVLFNEYDLPNGYATPLPYNVIGVFLAPPDEGQLLDNSDWLDLLLTHEFTHTVHLDKVRSVPGVLQTIFGRVPWFFPNVFQPGWAVEGLAVNTESDVASGRGRLRGPVFEAWLRAQAPKGFPSLAELNADGRSLPVNKAYLYGAYFYEFLGRRYGPDAIFKYVERYSGNIVPRLHTNPREITGKTLDVLWDEFLLDLRQRVSERSDVLRRQPEAVGHRMVGPMFDIGAVAALPGGAALAVLDDGLGATELVMFGPDGTRTKLTRVHPGTHIDVAPNGRVLLAQADVCNDRYLAYDLYRLEPDNSKTQLTSCARLRRAVQAGEAIAALHHDGGRTRLLLLDGAGREQRVLLAPPPDTDLIDLAAAPDGRSVSVIVKREGDWQVQQIDLGIGAATVATASGSSGGPATAAPVATPPPRVLFSHNAPLHSLHHGPAGLEFVAVSDGVYNVWRLSGADLVRLTHSHTSVVAQAGTQADGALWLSVIAADGYELRRLASPAPLQRVAVRTAPALGGGSGGGGSAATAAPSAAPAAGTGLAEGSRYLALRSLYPRSWLPAVSFDRGLRAFGASTFGADALGWHQYAAALQWETTQNELLGSVEYLFVGQHYLALTRGLTAKAWVDDGDSGERTTLYERHSKAQWLSAFPLVKRDRTLVLGVGAALDRVDSVQVDVATTTRQRDERIAAALVEFDTSGRNWWSEGNNRGQRSSLLYETYKPFARDGGVGYDGDVWRLDLRGFVPLGRSVLALRHTEVHARGRTEPFQLGGATDAQLQLGLALNDREIALRGYRGDEALLRGTDARVTSIEFRTPLADIDRHFMSPPLGINRLSATAFFDIGGAWSDGSRPLHYQRGVGVELLGEVKLLYALGLHLRVGVARGLDEPKGTCGYLSLGRPF